MSKRGRPPTGRKTKTVAFRVPEDDLNADPDKAEFLAEVKTWALRRLKQRARNNSRTSQTNSHVPRP